MSELFVFAYSCLPLQHHGSSHPASCGGSTPAKKPRAEKTESPEAAAPEHSPKNNLSDSNSSGQAIPPKLKLSEAKVTRLSEWDLQQQVEAWGVAPAAGAFDLMKRALVAEAMRGPSTLQQRWTHSSLLARGPCWKRWPARAHEMTLVTSFVPRSRPR